jgi:hypothetical protein
MHRRFRRPSAWFALFVLLFAQLALSVHACPVLERALLTEVAVADQSSPCAEMAGLSDGMPSPLCLEHCKGTVQATEQHSPVPPVGLAPVVALIVPAAAPEDRAPAVLAHPLHPPPDPIPVFASSSRLRI